MCMQCVRADRREVEGRPARWQQRQQVRVLFVDFQLDTSRFEHALREVGLVAERAGIAMREARDHITVTYAAAPTPAQLELGTDMSPFLHDARFGRGA